MFIFFFKQKTAYEMRISDWSSDVCSSDLGDAKVHLIARLEEDHRRLLPLADARRGAGDQQIARMERDEAADIGDAFRDRENHRRGVAGLHPLAVDVEEHVKSLAVNDLVGSHQPGPGRDEGVAGFSLRSEERRVGTVCVSTGGSR